MNVELETLPNCMATLRVELPPDRVDEERQRVMHGFLKQARIPGYRPGKAPKKIIETKFKNEIDEELRKRLVSDGFRDAVKAKDVTVLTLTEVDEVSFAQDSTFQFKATVVTAPKIELPSYKGIAVQSPSSEVTEEDLQGAIDDLRERSADFKDMEGRGLQPDDFAVVDFVGTIDGQPVAEVSPKVERMLGQRNDMWVKMAPDSFLTGFSEPLTGAVKGDQRSFDITLPENFPVSEIAGKTVHFEVTIKEVKERLLPELNDEWANTVVEGKTLEEVQSMLREEIAMQKKNASSQAVRRQIMDHLLNAVDFELPSNFVRSEARKIMEDMVRENSMRGVAEEELRSNEEQIVENSMEAARSRVKLGFILVKIGEEEKIQVTTEELTNRVTSMAARYQTPLDKFIKKIDENKALPRIQEELLITKVLDFLETNASVSAA